MSIKIRQKELKSGKKSLYLDIYYNGKRSYEFLGLYLTNDRKANNETKDLAESIRAKRQLEIQHNSHGFTPTFKKKANFVDYFERVTNSFQTATKDLYQNVLLKIKSFAGDHVQFGAIDERWVQSFRDHLLDSIKKNTARTYFAVLKAVLNRAVKEGIINTNPADKVDNFKKQKKLVSYLTTEELKKLANTNLDRWDLKDAFFFACYTGLRFTDVRNLKWDQIRNDRIEFRQKKTRAVEYVPLNKQAKEILSRMDKKRPNVFKVAHNSGVNMGLKVWAEDAGLERWIKNDEIGQRGLTFHVSRHTFAVHLLSNGVDVFTLKELMGHDSIDSTMIYAEIVSKTKEDAVNKFPDMKLG